MPYDSKLLVELIELIDARPRGYLSVDQIHIDGYSDESIVEHLKLMINEGLAHGKVQYADNKVFDIIISRLTMKGHRFLDANRKENNKQRDRPMNTYDLTEFQWDLLAQIVASDDAGKTAEQGYLIINHGGGKYVLWDPELELESLADLEALCDAGLLVNVSGKDPKYRIPNAARTAIANNFGKMEQSSSHELLARKFEEWQKEYMDEVNAYFIAKNRPYGEIAFNLWEQRFLSFLRTEAPSLIGTYTTKVQKQVIDWRVHGDIDKIWKAGKGDAVESFLDKAIKEARAKRIISESIDSSPALPSTAKPKTGGKIFIGHGRSRAWKDLRDFIRDRLRLECDEFNRESTAGTTTVARLEEMLEEASFAFLVMTAEDQHQDQTFHARENVIHEAGLFQGKLGFKKAIILLEAGCAKFSNIEGLTDIRFPKDDIESVSEEIRRVLEREGILK